MATSSALSTSNQYVKYKITVIQNTQNITSNTSNVTVKVMFYRTNTGYTTYGSGTVYCKINGTTYTASVTSDQKITSSGIVLFSKTLNIPHNADGTKVLTTSAWISLNTPLTSSEQSYNQTLTTIPRATTPTLSVSSVNIGSNLAINLNPASGSFTHTLTYTLGNTSGSIASGVSSSYTWAIPMSLCSLLPNTTRGQLTIFCATYNGSTKIGTKSVTITVNVPSTVVPGISAVTIAENNSSVSNKFSAYIKNNSTLKVNITASGSYGSSITSYTTTIQGKSYQGASVVSDVLTVAGTSTITIKVVDSRGRSTTVTRSLTVVDYSEPTITKFNVYRSTSAGVADNEGEYLTVEYAYTTTAIDGNNVTFTLEYAQSPSSTFTSLFSSVESSKTDVYTSSIVFSGDYAFDVKITLFDSLKSIVYMKELPTAFVLIDLKECGRGIAFGKVAERDRSMEIALDIYDKFDTRILNGLSMYGGRIDPNTTLEELILTDNENVPPVGGFFYIRTMFYSTKSTTSNRTQVATPYNNVKSRYYRYYFNGSWSSWIEEVVLVSEGTSGIWTYRKWSNKKAECYGQIPISSVAISTALGSWYSSIAPYAGSDYTYPFTFSSVPNVTAQFATSNGTGALVWLNDQGTTSTPPTCYLIRPTSATGASGFINVQVEGSY